MLAKLKLFGSDEFGTVKLYDIKNYFNRVLSKDDRLKQEIAAFVQPKGGIRVRNLARESALWEEYNLLIDPVERLEIDEDTKRTVTTPTAALDILDLQAEDQFNDMVTFELGGHELKMNMSR